jgi:hypothetical protein
MSRKSLKHQALSRAHRAAVEAGTLPEFYAKRDADRAAERALRSAQSEAAKDRPNDRPNPAEPTPANIDVPYVPSAEFQRAYSVPSGPEAAVWDDRGYCRWTLPVCSMGSRPTPPRNF